MNPDDLIRRKHRNRARTFTDAETPAAQAIEAFLRARAQRLDRLSDVRSDTGTDPDEALRRCLARRR